MHYHEKMNENSGADNKVMKNAYTSVDTLT